MSVPTGQRAKILVVDDEPSVRALVSRLLSVSFDVTEAVDGSDALDKILGGETPDLIVTDVMMPHMDGLTFTKELKRDPKLARIPIVMLTAKARASEMVEGINAGARAYVVKPFKSEELLGKVRKALGQAK
jgi:two-component system chemotaxis response regulator CheY